MTTFRLSMAILAAALVLAGCGRKNLPVAPRPVTTPVGESRTPNSDNSPASTASFQRAARIGAAAPGGSTSSSLNVSPAEVSRNPTAEKKSFPLDFLLN